MSLYYVLLVILLVVTTSLADLRLSCHTFTPTICPGTVVNCECTGASSFLTWNITDKRSSCSIKYLSLHTEMALRDGNCTDVTSDVSKRVTGPSSLLSLNSNLSINLTKSVTVSCTDNINSTQNFLQLASMSYMLQMERLGILLFDLQALLLPQLTCKFLRTTLPLSTIVLLCD